MLEKIFESLDEKVFTADLKKALQEKFEEAVEAKAEEISESKIEDHIVELNEKSEQHIEFLNEKSEEYVKQKEEEMLESINKYLERIVEEFVQEKSDELAESVKNDKADMIIEAFESMLVATGVKVSTIVEAKNNSSVDSKLSESVEKYDALMEELLALKEENQTLIKMGTINELCEGLSLVESEKFKKLADIVPFTKDKSYVEKLEQIKESISVSSKKEDKLVEKAEVDGEALAWAHLI